MTTNIKKKFIFILGIFLFAAPLISSDAVDIEKEYFRQKSLGNYTEALKLLESWSLTIEDPVLAEVNIHRIRELMLYPELFDHGIDALDGLTEKISKSNPQLIWTVRNMKSDLLLYRGRIKESSRIVEEAGYLNFYITGPFPNSGIDEFEKAFPPAKGYSPGALYQGKISHTSWWQAKNDLTGKLSVENFCHNVRNSAYYLQAEFGTSSDGEYVLYIGKTGYADVILDGVEIFKNRKKHGYSKDQYYVRVRLSAGKHTIIAKAGDTSGSTRFSIRVADTKGNPVSGNILKDEEPGSCERISHGYNSALESLTKKENLEDAEKFHAGYLFNALNLIDSSGKPELKHFTSVAPDSPYMEQSLLYLSRLEGNSIKEEKYLNEILKINSRNIEALAGLIRLKIKYNLLYDAYPLIEKIKNTRHGSHLYYFFLAEFLQKKEWQPEVEKVLSEIGHTDYPSIGNLLEYKTSMSQGDYLKAIKPLSILASMNQYNVGLINDLVKCYIQTGSNPQATGLLRSASALFPDMPSFRISLAKELALSEGPDASIPVLSSAKRIAPYNREVLFELGKAYLKIDQNELALYCLNLASAQDPDNFELKRYISSISGKKNDLARYVSAEDFSSLIRESDKYMDEPAVHILNEIALKVNNDGSYERSVREIVKINDEDEIKNNGAKFVIYDPSSESVEEVRCFVYNGASRVEMQERISKSLSDPESRLYYNQIALAVPVSSLQKGSIIEFRYVLKTRGTADYKYYFGKKFLIGGSRRVLRTNIVLFHPVSKKIYLHTNRLGKKSISRAKISGGEIYRISVDNTPPYRKEPAMQPESDFLPYAYFTSFKNWNEFHKWYLSLIQDRIKLSPEMKDAAKKISSSTGSKLERARKLYYLITDKIRYVGFEFGVGTIQPRPTDSTYHSGMGDCKDMSLTLAAMLREAGIKADMAILRTRDRGRADLSVPLIGEFNHAICFVDIGNGFFLDPTASSSGFRELPIDNRNLTAVVISDRGHRFVNTADGFYVRDMVETTTDITLNPDGVSSIDRKVSKIGSEAPSLRISFKNPDQKLRSLNEYWNEKFPGSTVSNYRVIEDGYDSAVSYAYKIKIRDFAQAINDELVFNAFLTKSDYYSGFAALTSRRHPLVFPGDSRLRIKSNFTIPANYSAALIPADEEYRDKNFLAVFKYRTNGNIISIEAEIRIEAQEIPAHEYKNFREFAKFVNRKELEKIVIRKKKY